MTRWSAAPTGERTDVSSSDDMRLDEAALPHALAHLSSCCGRLAAALDHVGAPRIRRRPQGFSALLQVIVEQQVSTAAGRAIWERVASGGVETPEAVLARDDASLRALGLSGPKVRAARATATAARSGALCFERIAAAPTQEAIAEMTAVTGVGPWTATIYQMFAVGRADLMPVGDVALQEAARRLYGLETRPKGVSFEELSAPWAPWRTGAALLLWRYYEAARAEAALARGEKRR